MDGHKKYLTYFIFTKKVIRLFIIIEKKWRLRIQVSDEFRNYQYYEHIVVS